MVIPRWRTGRKVARTIYLQLGDEPSDWDVLYGVMDTPELAAATVRGLNRLTAQGDVDLDVVLRELGLDPDEELQ